MKPGGIGRVITALFVALCVFASPRYCHAGCAEGNYALSVTPAKNLFSQGDEIKLLITFSNPTSADVAVDIAGLAYGVVGFSGQAKNNSNSRTLKLANTQGANPRLPPDILAQQIKQVKAHSTYTEEVILSHKGMFSPRPGRYVALAHYQPPSDERLHIQMLSCALDANRTEFEVKK